MVDEALTGKQQIDEEFLELYDRDVLKRKTFVNHFIRLLKHLESKSNIVALEGVWGEGKTVFVKQAINLLIACHAENRNKLEETWKQYIDPKIMDGFPDDIVPIYFDAWKMDKSSSPTLAIAYEIVKNLNLNWGKSTWFDKEKLSESFTGIATSSIKLLSKLFWGVDLDSIISELKSLVHDVAEAPNTKNTFDYLAQMESEKRFNDSLVSLFGSFF